MDTLPVNIPGFVWAYRFSPEEKTAVRLNNSATVAELTADNCFYWLHLNVVDTRVPALLDTLDGLTEDAKSALTTRDTHAAITVDEQMLYGTLIDCQRDFAQDTNNLGWLHFAMSDRFIITTRLQPLRSVERARALIEKNPGKFSRPVDLFELLVIEFQRTLIAIVIELTEELNQIEDIVYDSAQRDERRRLAPVRRTVVRLHRHLRTVLALMRRAAAADDDEMPFGFDDVARRLTSRLETVDHDIYALQDRARLLHEEIDSKQSSETNRHLYLLSIMTAFLLPPTLVTGFFGMNTANLPFAVGDYGTEYAVALIVASIAFAWWLLRRVDIL
ncbi:transporter [Rhizobium ruizarguesonis]|uniref:transporter n=1 Tax=Rhizobium ruizarguesonis TaxID=2081791 RepID=UPI00103236C7|nr:transporter [Rhizobium ruizarguesonis]TAZ38603.1 transporter [Rhizobium ruizarguesonis]